MSNDTLLREVDDELRGDRLRALWKRFGPYVIGGAVAIVLLVAINEGWQWWQSSNAARSSDQFYAALELADGTDVAAAQEALNRVAAEGSGGYPTLARFRQASLLAGDGKTAEAIAAYDSLASSQSNARLRELALVFSAYLLVDSGDVAAVQQRIAGLNTPENPLRNAAREALGLAQYKAGQLNAALETLQAILDDPFTSQALAGRIQIYVAQLIAQGAQTTAASATVEPASGASEPPTSVGGPPAMDVAAPVDASPADASPAETEPAPAAAVPESAPAAGASISD